MTKSGKEFIRHLPTMISRFEMAYIEGTDKRRGSMRNRIYHHRVILQIFRVNTSAIRLLTIETIPLIRGNGFGTACLEWLCGLADLYNITIYLTASNVSETSLVQLVTWYQKHGFKLLYGTEMVRYPCSLTT